MEKKEWDFEKSPLQCFLKVMQIKIMGLVNSISHSATAGPMLSKKHMETIHKLKIMLILQISNVKNILCGCKARTKTRMAKLIAHLMPY